MSAPRKIILKKLKELNTVWHPESTLVFKSQEEKVVTGRYVDNEFIPLDDEALDLCTKWSFKYDTSLVEDDEDDENNGEESSNDDDIVEEKPKQQPLQQEEPDFSQRKNPLEMDKEEWISKFLIEEMKVNDFSKILNDINNLSANLNEYYKNVSENLANKYFQSEAKAHFLETELRKKCDECEVLTNERDMLRNKFEGFKNFFLS